MVTHVTLLGRATFHTSAERLEPPFGKLTALLYYVVYQQAWVSRDDLVYLFYPNLEERKARQNLRPLLTKLRQLPYTEGLEIEPTRIRWSVQTDVEAFKKALESGHLAEVVAQYRGVLLDGFRLSTAPEFESWLELERSELQRRWRDAALAFTAELENQGRHRHAAELLRRVYKAEPLDEPVFRRYLAALAGAGKKSDALQAFETFKALLNDEVASEPEPETCALVARVRSSEESPEVLAPPETDPPAKPPASTTAFVGRETEIGHIVTQLGEPACRLLTVLGPGGMGKTRLAAEVGERLEPEFTDGVGFIPFEAVDSPASLVFALADALAFSFFGPRDPKDQLLEYLATKNMLLVMDNLEHLLGGVGLVTEMLQTAPRLKILATSRERLNLHAEWVYDLAGLSVPDVGDADIEPTDAVKLFVQTAKKARADFTLDGHAASVAHICRALGGMPLALELAASWLRVLSPDEVAEELENGLALLESSLRDLPERHHDLRAVFGASWRRLSENEQLALQKLAIFHGGFTKEAARAVADTDLPLLLALVNKSFLQFDSSGRFAQHPLIRQYLREKAETDPETFVHTQEKHALYFAAVVQEREASLRGLEARAVRKAIVLDLANVRAAWFWAVEGGRETLFDQASEGLLEFYMNEERFQEGEAVFAYAAEKLPGQSVVRGRALRNQGFLSFCQLDHLKAAELLRESVAIFQSCKAKRDKALALEYLALAYGYSGRPSSETEAVWRECAELCREVGDAYHEARALGNLAPYCRLPAEREHRIRASIKLFREVGGYFGLTLVLQSLAFDLSRTHGAYPEANRHLDEAVELERARGVANRLACWLNVQGKVFSFRGHFAKAEACYLEARDIGTGLGPGHGMWELERALSGLGRLAHLRGDLSGARYLFTRALELNTRHADPMDVKKEILLDFAKLAAAENNLAEAEDLCLRTGFDERDVHEFGYAWLEVDYLNQLGAITLAQRDSETAARHFHTALAVVQNWHFLPAALELCVNFADLARHQGDEQRATRLFKLAADHPASMYETKEAAKRGLETLPTTAVTGEARAEAVGLEQIIAELTA